MTGAKPNKHELRTKETRELLLQSAEKIFVRDGYEGAELGEIAALAGRTKGAIYAHFKSKEDIFLALIELHSSRYRAEMEQALARSTGIEENLTALRNFYHRLTEEQPWGLLFLEFKLYALRHPESKEKLQRHFDEVVPRANEERIQRFLGPAPAGAVGRSVAVQSLQPLISALAVETNFMPGLHDQKVLQDVVNRIFDALLPPSSQ